MNSEDSFEYFDLRKVKKSKIKNSLSYDNIAYTWNGV